MPLDDPDYYRARAIQEQLAAQKATSPEAGRRHRELALLYRFRAAMLSRPGDWVETPIEAED